ncbi:unnamed protein product [Candida verbasci]|uniref:Alpha/beta hydrolase n=1 Tax=Candida verbasci TaxID=1227364 RepID=A0A9W4TY03_9ASCO|nr:unnamed protein product [Candida verbasci]
MKLLEFNPGSFSKVEYNIGGINTYIYNSEVLKSYVESFSHHHREDIPINVLYLIHQREGNYTYTESIAYNILKQYKSQTPLICITFDLRNHGARVINNQNNKGWSEGNKSHGVDMWSIINGTIDDITLLMDQLPTYLNLEPYLNETSKNEHKVKFKYHNFLSGVSLGGHIVYRFALRYPNLVKIINPIIGSTDLTSLLYTRLKGIDNYTKKYFYFEYDELDLTEEERLEMYPETLHNQLSKVDTEIFESFPMGQVKLFACFGGKDELVPFQLSKTWCDLYQGTNTESGIMVEDVGHDITEDMIIKFGQWLNKHV